MDAMGQVKTPLYISQQVLARCFVKKHEENLRQSLLALDPDQNQTKHILALINKSFKTERNDLFLIKQSNTNCKRQRHAQEFSLYSILTVVVLLSTLNLV